ncbi:MAG: DUF1501 domain-containing protein [Planctomycetaceae bacterium]
MPSAPPPVPASPFPRRAFLRSGGMGFGSLALAGLLAREGAAASLPTHFAPRAKRVIHVFLNGGMSQVDTFDPKPELQARGGQMLPFDNLQTERKTGVALPSPFAFTRHGESGIPISEIFPCLARHADDLAVIRSMHVELPNHEMSLMLMNTGHMRQVRPSFGSWLTWGMGQENDDLPGFIALVPGGMPVGGAGNWRAAFLPGAFQGTHVDTSKADPADLIEHIRNARMAPERQREQFALLRSFNARHALERPGDEALEARIRSFELAYRMQLEATDAFDVTQEPKHVLEAYGPGPQNRQLLMARRLVERGVRFVQTWHGNLQPWDSHSNIRDEHTKVARECDQGLGALLADLKARGMLHDTLVLCTGEFGRTPSVEMGTNGAGASQGRDHNHWGFSLWLAGGGVKGGTIHGATDDFGFRAVQDPVSVHDLHATMLRLLGFDHTRLTYRYAGRDYRLTDLEGEVVTPILA